MKYYQAVEAQDGDRLEVIRANTKADAKKKFCKHADISLKTFEDNFFLQEVKVIA